MTAYELAYYYIDSVKNQDLADAFYATAVYKTPLNRYDSDRLTMVASYLRGLTDNDGLLSEAAADQLKAYLSKLEAYLKKPKAQGQGDSPTS